MRRLGQTSNKRLDLILSILTLAMTIPDVQGVGIYDDCHVAFIQMKRR